MARAKKDVEKISFYVDRQVMEDLRAYENCNLVDILDHRKSAGKG